MSRTLAINLSSNRGSSYDATGVDSIKLDFPLDSADFSRQGDTLVISSNDGSGAQALLNNYFTENETHELPTLELQDGTVVSGVDFLNTYEIDTAAGPSETTSGLNSYGDDAGELVSGIDKLGVLGKSSHLSNVHSSNEDPFIALSNDEELVISERFVFQPTSQITSEVTINVAHSHGQTVAVLSHNKKYIKELTVDPNDGSIRVELTEAGQDALKTSGSKAFSLDLTVSVDGETRSVEVILNASKDFISSEADAMANHADNPITYEHHIMKETYKDGHLVAGGTKGSDVTVTTSDSDGVKNVTIEGTEHTTVNITTSGKNNSGISAEKGETNTLHSLDSVTIKASSTGENGNIESSVGIKNTVEGEMVDVNALREKDWTVESNEDWSPATAKAAAEAKATAEAAKVAKDAYEEADYAEYEACVAYEEAEKAYKAIVKVEDVKVEDVEVAEERYKAVKAAWDAACEAKEKADVVADVAAYKAIKAANVAERVEAVAGTAATTTISDIKNDVTITGNSCGILSNGIFATVATTISNVGKNVNITGNDSGIYSKGHTASVVTTISDIKNDVTITGNNYGILNCGTSTVTIENVKNDVTITSKSRGIWNKSDDATTTIREVGGNVTITSTNSDGVGIFFEENESYAGKVEITKVAGNVATDAICLRSSADLKISEVGNDVTVNNGIYCNDSSATITNVKGGVTIIGKNDSYGINNSAGTIKISDVGKNVTITGGKASISTSSYATTTIDHVNGNVSIEGGTTGISTSGKSSTTIEGVTGTVTISGDDNAVYSDNNAKATIIANNIELNGRVHAESGATNRISSSDSSAITLTITANDAGGVALSANGKGSQNIIHGHSTAGTSDHITIVGGIQADSSCVNKITTGNGNDVITLDGKIYSADSLDINMGTGWNQLVLTAPTIDEFMDRYGDWLTKLADNNTNIADSLGISTIDIESPNKDLSFDEFLAQLGNDTFYTLIDSLHDHGVDITYHDDGNIWESHHTVDHTLDLTNYTSALDLHLSDDVHTVYLHGGHYSHILDMGDGDDTLLSIDGTDLTGATIHLGSGNDHLSLAGDVTLDNTAIDAGSGYDVLELGHLSALQSSEGSLDLSSIADSVSGFEVIDISGSSGTLHIDMDSLLDLGIDSANAVHYTSSDSAQGFDVNNLHADNTLVIKADSDESVSFEDTNWQTSGATVSEGEHKYTVYTNSSMSHEEEQCFILLQTGTMK